jgi:hypothetical protein
MSGGNNVKLYEWMPEPTSTSNTKYLHPTLLALLDCTHLLGLRLTDQPSNPKTVDLETLKG